MNNSETNVFEKAKPIFLASLDATTDVQAGFYLPFDAPSEPRRATLRCAAATFYRAYLNGEMIAHGPARAAHGMARVDEIDLTTRLRAGANRLAIEVAGYAQENYYTTGDASFVQAEVVIDEAVVVATDAGCRAIHLTQRLPAERFSHARCTGEIYALDVAFVDWRVGKIDAAHATAIVAGPTAWLPRVTSLPTLHPCDQPTLTAVRSMRFDAAKPVRKMGALETDAYLERIKDVPERPATENARDLPAALRGTSRAVDVGTVQLEKLSMPAAAEYDFGTLQSGFLAVEFETPAAATIDVCFVDHLDDAGEIDPRLGDMNGAIRLHVPAGRVRFVAFEPHCFRHVRVVVRGCESARLHGVGAIDYAHPDTAGGTFACSDNALDRIYQSARLTLRLNTLDVFMDCPGRERAGWLCDSLFSGRAMQVLWGDARVERAMLENFLHAPQDLESAPGFFPECYPAKRNRGGNFIPNWSMFLAIELCEYARRSGDVAFAEAYRKRIEQLVAGLHVCEDAHGLLVKLPGYWFVDWSKANDNDYKKPISTATNALYARMLDDLSAQFGRRDWADRAAKVRAAIRPLVPADGYLPDALRHDGDALALGDSASEAAQYYHFWTGLLDAGGDHAATWKRLVDRAGPLATEATRDAALAPSNVFIGLYLRLEMLAETGLYERLLDEMRGLFGPMLARGPGTLWENLKPDGSVCHGFASHAAVWLVRDVLGIGLPDAIEKTIRIAPHPAGLAWARGTVPVGDDFASVEWRAAAAGGFSLIARVPTGYAGVLVLPASIVEGKTVRAGVNDVAMPAGGLQFEGAIEVVVERGMGPRSCQRAAN